MREVKHIVFMGEIRNAYKMLIRIPQEKRPLRGLRHRWEDSIKMDLREIRVA
jgi:hypothetical protein